MAETHLDLPDLKTLHEEHTGLPAWAWPLIGLLSGALLVAVIHAVCFVDPEDD